MHAFARADLHAGRQLLVQLVRAHNPNGVHALRLQQVVQHAALLQPELALLRLQLVVRNACQNAGNLKKNFIFINM